MRTLIVDGYNVVHAWPMLQQLLRARGMEEARRRLVSTLAEYAAQTGVSVTVVFDAHARPASSAVDEMVDGVTVRYGSRGASADNVIERLANHAARSGSAADVVVATNDRLQRHLVGGMGVASLGVRSLVEELERVAGDVAQQSARLRTAQHHTRRVEHQLPAEVSERLERIRRGEV